MVFTIIKNIYLATIDFLHSELTAIKSWWIWSTLNVGIFGCALSLIMRGEEWKAEDIITIRKSENRGEKYD